MHKFAPQVASHTVDRKNTAPVDMYEIYIYVCVYVCLKASQKIWDTSSQLLRAIFQKTINR